LETKESKLESRLHGFQMDLHHTTFLVWTSHGLVMELHPNNPKAHKQNGLIGQGILKKGLTLD